MFNAAQNVVNCALVAVIAGTVMGSIPPVPHKRSSNVKEREKENIDRIL